MVRHFSTPYGRESSRLNGMPERLDQVLPPSKRLLQRLVQRMLLGCEMTGSLLFKQHTQGEYRQVQAQASLDRLAWQRGSHGEDKS